MYLSVAITALLEQDEGSNFVTVKVQEGINEGRVERIPWESFFGVPHTVTMVAPKGEAHVMSTKVKKQRSSRQERRRIEAVGGRSHVGSGAFAGHKSDGSTDKWRMENKFTTAQSYRVTLSDIHKLRSECRNGQAPVFNVDFQEKRTGATKESWVLIPHKEWERLVNAVDHTE